MTEEIGNARGGDLMATAREAGRRFEEGEARPYRYGSRLFSDEVRGEETEKLARERNGTARLGTWSIAEVPEGAVGARSVGIHAGQATGYPRGP